MTKVVVPAVSFLSKAWAAGASLYSCPAKFASAEVREASKKMQQGKALSLSPQPVAFPDSNLAHLFNLTFMVIEHAFPSDRAEIVRHLQCGDLIAVGFKLPRELSDLPVRIPARVWSGKADFGDSAVTGVGFSFVEVRVLTRDAWDALACECPQQAVQTKSVGGRPTLKKQIWEAMEAEHKSQPLCDSYRDPDRVDRIRKRLKEMYPGQAADWDDLDPQTLRKYRHDFCGLRVELRPPQARNATR